jgi:thiol:disulfide interchange protein
MLVLALLLAAQSGTAAQKYNPARNADQDIRNAMVEAQKTGKRILLEVGGQWCSWCHVLDKYFQDNPNLRASRDRNYLTLKINFSPENENKAVLSRYPTIPGYPHFFVLDTDGKLLHSQGTTALEEGATYNLARFTAFLDKWAPPNSKVR